MLDSRGQQRLTDVAEALDVAPSTAGRMCDRLVRKDLVRRHRPRTDRRAVLVSVTAAGRQVVDQDIRLCGQHLGPAAGDCPETGRSG